MVANGLLCYTSKWDESNFLLSMTSVYSEVIHGGHYVWDHQVDEGHYEAWGHYVPWGLIWLRCLCITKLQQKMEWEQLFAQNDLNSQRSLEVIRYESTK